MRTHTPLLRRALRIALPPVLAISGLTAAAAPSVATPAIGSGWLDVFLIAGGFDVCVEGEVPPSTRVAGVWTLSITGIRVDEVGGTWLVDPAPWTSSDWTVDVCQSVYTFGYPYGEFQVEFTYAAAGEYVTVHSSGGATWHPLTGPRTWGVNPTT